MAQKSVDTIVADVRVCLDETDINEAEFLHDADSKDMVNVIKSKIPDAIRHVYLNADQAFIAYKVKTGKAVSGDDGVVTCTLDPDFLRLVYARLDDWKTSVTEAIMHTDRRYAALKNPITTGYPDNPKAAIVDDAEDDIALIDDSDVPVEDGEDVPVEDGEEDTEDNTTISDTYSTRKLELYSSSTKSGEVRYVYGYVNNPTLSDGYYEIDERVYRAVVYQAAGLTLQAFKDAHAESMFNMALTMMK